MPNDVLQEVGKAVTDIPKDFTPHRLIKKLFQQRRDMITGDARKPLVDWGMAETLAFGTLLSEGGVWGRLLHIRCEVQAAVVRVLLVGSFQFGDTVCPRPLPSVCQPAVCTMVLP